MSISPANRTPRYGVPSAAIAATVRSSIGQIAASVAASTEGTGAYAPIPPVFGPVSPSPTRLWSRLSDSGTVRSPSLSAKADTSGPSSSSSTTTTAPAAPKDRSTRQLRIAAIASSRSGATTTPLPAARPSAFTTARPPSSSTNALAFSTSSKLPERAVGMPLRCKSSFAKAFDPSRRAAEAVGPKTTTPRACSASASPPTSGSSGPTTTRSGRRWSTRLTICATSSIAARMALGQLRDAGVPGSRQQARHGGILREPPHERVLATAAADDEDLHDVTGTLCSRAGPTPIIDTGTPPSSSRKRTYPCASFGRSSNTCASPSSSSQPGSSSHTGSA